MEDAPHDGAVLMRVPRIDTPYFLTLDRTSPHLPVPSGKATINSTFGTRVAVLAGDYLFAQVGVNDGRCGWMGRLKKVMV